MKTINTVNDFILQVAHALETGDLDELEIAELCVDEWMIDANERAAYTALLEAAYTAIEASEA